MDFLIGLGAIGIITLWCFLFGWFWKAVLDLDSDAPRICVGLAISVAGVVGYFALSSIGEQVRHWIK